MFLTLSASPNLENLRSLIKSFLDEGSQNRKLVILDDVWTKESLDMLMFKIPGATTLVVSRFNLTVPRTTYNVEFLKEDEATSVFCICAFGAKFPPHRCRKVLIEQVIIFHFMPLIHTLCFQILGRLQCFFGRLLMSVKVYLCLLKFSVLC